MKFDRLCLLALLSLIFIWGCNSDSQKKNAKIDQDASSASKLTFRDVNGIRFFEVKRRFRNGLSFNKDGFQQEPTWIIQVKSPDTMLAYSPEKKGMEAFYLQYDHGEVYNFAREFFRVKVISKDSLVLQRLQVDGKIIADDDDVRSDVYSTYFTKNYIENVLKTTIGELQRPTKADTLFIKDLAAKTNKDPSNATIAFAAREPVIFTPKGDFITVEKISTQDEATHRSAAYDYMYPEYRIEIKKSYKAFAYRYSVIVDATGKMYVNRVEGVMKDDIPFRKKLLQGITDVYIRNLLKTTPGNTLGIPHSSEITLNVVGKLAP
jgi:hypothetical protein